MPEDIYWHQYKSSFRTFPFHLPDWPGKTPDMIICIPSRAEPRLTDTLNSINQCVIGDFRVAVIILMNANKSLSIDELEIHHDSLQAVCKWVEEHGREKMSYAVLNPDPMPEVKGGVGLARKIAMDEAARILDPDGIIVCLDADCCVEENYLIEINTSFHQAPDMEAASIYFEHALDGLDENARDHITQYELHLRYLVHAHWWCGHPFAYHAVGSSMAVRRNAYLKQGGMNTRSAGEDFYFLHKFIENDKLFEIKSTTVYPSARMSHRVPFGTGRAMQELRESNGMQLTTDFESFRKIRPLFASLPQLRQLIADENNAFNNYKLAEFIGLDPEIISYLNSIDFGKSVTEIYKHTNSLQSFQKRFFRYFNAFRMIRYTHYMRDHFFPDVMVAKAAQELLSQNGITTQFLHNEEMLCYFRKMDKTDPV